MDFGELKKHSPRGGGAADRLWTAYRRKRIGPMMIVIVVVVVVVVVQGAGQHVCFFFMIHRTYEVQVVEINVVVDANDST